MQAQDSLAAAARARAQAQAREQIQAQAEGASKHTMDYAAAVAPGTAAQGKTAAVDTESPAAMMMQLVRFKDDDPELNSETNKRLVTNEPTAYKHIRRTREHLCTGLETGIKQPGVVDDKALRVFVADVNT